MEDGKNYVTENLMFFIFIKYYYGNQVKKRKRDGTHGTKEKDVNCICLQIFEAQGNKKLVRCESYFAVFAEGRFINYLSHGLSWIS
jgi:hypothetical protein